MPKIYTKTGDDGTTGLAGGKRVRKNDPRIECIGDIDELNACIGLCAIATTNAGALRQIQNELFIIGSNLAAEKNTNLPQLSEAAVIRLEKEIDSAESLLQPLANFILPGGTELAGRLHLARTICRRAERHIISLKPLPYTALVYLNRLSDWLFMYARYANQIGGINDIIWKNPDA